MLPERYTHSFWAMTTRCDLLFYGVDQAQGQRLASAIEARVGALVLRYNFHSNDSWLSRAVNGRRHSRVPLNAEAIQVLHTVRKHAEQCGGVFDITVGTYAAKLKLASSADEVAQLHSRLCQYTGLDRWWLDGDALVFDNSITRIDLGGVIKEYAVDISAELARDAGVLAGLVNYGGDLACWGLKPDGQRFVAAIPNPQAPDSMLFGMDLYNQALTTSGHYARQRNVKGGVLSHIVGHAVSPWLSCSVVSRSALVSGIYSTALLLKGDITLPADVLALAVNAQGQVHTLEGPTV